MVENGADIHSKDNEALKLSTMFGNLNIVKYFIIDCNMSLTKEIINYLNKNNYLEVLKMIDTRDLQQRLEQTLDNNSIINNKPKIKI